LSGNVEKKYAISCNFPSDEFMHIVQILIVFLVPTIVTVIFETEKPGSSRKK
jgi:hypothetical protein